jgi:hypothetical protein
VQARVWVITIGVWAVSTIGIAIGAFVVGAHNPSITVVSGKALVGESQATVSVDGWSYAIPIDVAWKGSDGIWRDRGRPACLALTGSNGPVPIQFGWVATNTPDGRSWRQVVWVSCGS